MSHHLTTLARDEAAEAEVVIVAQYSDALSRYMYATHVQHAGLIWTGCMHGHKTTGAAAKCAVAMANGWTDGRSATEIVLVSPGLIEWQWVTGKSKGGTPLGEFRRCRPEPVGSRVTEHIGFVAEVARTA